MTRTSTEERGGSLNAWGTLAASVLILLTGLLLIGGDAIGPRITDFNFSGRQIKPKQQQLKFTFSRFMDQESVEEGYFMDPFTEGKMSWSGRMMVFTPKYNYLPGVKYTVRFDYGKDIYDKKLKPVKFTFGVAAD